MIRCPFHLFFATSPNNVLCTVAHSDEGKRGWHLLVEAMVGGGSVQALAVESPLDQSEDVSSRGLEVTAAVEIIGSRVWPNCWLAAARALVGGVQPRVSGAAGWPKHGLRMRDSHHCMGLLSVKACAAGAWRVAARLDRFMLRVLVHIPPFLQHAQP